MEEIHRSYLTTWKSWSQPVSLQYLVCLIEFMTRFKQIWRIPQESNNLFSIELLLLNSTISKIMVLIPTAFGIKLCSTRSKSSWVEELDWWLQALHQLQLMSLTPLRFASVLLFLKVTVRLNLLLLRASPVRMIHKLVMSEVHYLALELSWEIFQKCNIYQQMRTPEEKFAIKVTLFSKVTSRMQRRQKRPWLKTDGCILEM